MATGTSVRVDTGARENRCTHSIADRLQGSSLSLVGNGALEAACGPETSGLEDSGPWDMVAGMDTLSGLTAFGWELDPFRMYFVPAPGAM